jgi:hypothetical protein
MCKGSYTRTGDRFGRPSVFASWRLCCKKKLFRVGLINGIDN